MNTSNPHVIDNDEFWSVLFAANAIAVIGAKDIPGSWGHDAMKALLDSAKAGFNRRVYAVNPNVKEVLGLNSYTTVLDIPDTIELAIIVVPAEAVLSVLKQCGQKKVKAAVIISAGFAEIGEDGARLEAELVKTARETGIRFVGPNCIGHIDTHSRLSSAAFAGFIKPGSMGLLSQSGTLGASIMQVATHMGIGISKFVSTGNEAVLRLEDYLEFLARDENTRIITAYIEGLREGRRFFQLAREITTKKPIVVIKSGSTGESAKAARSHTGALSGTDAVYSAVFKQTGVIRAEDEEELCDFALAVLNQPLPKGNRIGIITIGGGFGVVTAEICEKEGLKISSFSPQTLNKLDTILPPRWSHGNPVDLVGIRPKAGENTIPSCIRFVMEDTNVDGVIALLPPSVTMHGPMGDFSPEAIRTMQIERQKALRLINQSVKQYNKPLLFIRRYMPSSGSDISAPPDERVIEYSHPRRAARVMRSLAWYNQYLEDRKKDGDIK